MTESVLTALRGRTPAPEAIPPKLRHAFDLLGAVLPNKLYLRDLAAAVALSQSSLSRLFAAETGAGFPATRVCREMTGVAPSELVRHRHLCADLG
ncbi:hypothetical protein [Nocardia sp. NPDC004415]